MIKTVFFTQVRKYSKEYTQSDLFIPEINERFCYVLEDKQQPYGVKVNAETCIPEAIYNVTITFSNRFKKDMIQLYNTQDLAVEKNGIRFVGVRVHGGNDVDDSEGCPLVGYHVDGKGNIWKSASDDILKIIRGYMDKGIQVKWVIVS